MTPYPRSLARSAAVAAALLALLAGLWATAPAAHADDVDLLRKDGGQPFVFVILDTSASMSLAPDTGGGNGAGVWAPRGADDPSSKLFQIKSAAYEVFRSVDNLNFGFASYNQDDLRVRAKHWLYTPKRAVSWSGTQITYPAAGDQWTFGRAVVPVQNVSGEQVAVAGTCLTPLDFSRDRAKIDRFSRHGGVTRIWIEDRNKTYRLTLRPSKDPAVDEDGSINAGIGGKNLAMNVTLERATSCPLGLTAIDGSDTNPKKVGFSRIGDFLMVEADVGPTGQEAQVGGEIVNSANCTGGETIAGYWNYSDVLATGTCGSGSSRPHTGEGWDSAQVTETPEDQCCYELGDDPALGCVDDPTSLSVPICYNLRFPTTPHADHRELDLGDVVPLHWELDNKDEFLRRLNPRHPAYDPSNEAAYFGVASYFQDQPIDNLLRLKNPNQRPLMAIGHSPLGRAVNDFRCWYLGDDGNKCRNGAKVGRESFDPGWEELFRQESLLFGCRLPYLIVISDGEDNSKGNNPTADTSDLFNRSAVRTFVITFKETAQLKTLAKEGEVYLVNNRQDLVARLRDIVGIIEQESRTFASAAVPSVQATVEDKIFLTNFTPLNDYGIWDGHVHSFLKPLPLDPITGRPDFDHPTRHLWDAGEVVLGQSAPPAANGDNSSVDLRLGAGVDRRRVFYSLERDPTQAALAVPALNRRLLDRTGPTATTSRADQDWPLVEPDFWDGLGISYDPADPDSVDTARGAAHRVLEHLLLHRSYVDNDGNAQSYILGDIFHSDPLLIGGPSNLTFFSQDYQGYRDFFRRHENRRKVLITGANDGALHVFDAGKAAVVERPATDTEPRRHEVEFDNGTGTELMAYVPRTLLPTLTSIANDPARHHWGVDGSPVAADVFVDPVHAGTPDPDRRSWRTVVVAGLREGGRGYFALDLTHPDRLETKEIGPVAEPVRDVVVPTDRQVLPDCIATTGSGGLDCEGGLPYGTPLWEFEDEVWDPARREWLALDEEDVDGDGVADGNGRPDLGETWSKPNIGLIKVTEGGAVVDKFVAVFGGGLDQVKADGQGDWLYMVDVETGRAIYKRRLEGSAPGGPAAVDTDQDGYLDRVYIGTTAGFLYRVDLDGAPPLANEMVRAVDGTILGVQRIPESTAGGADVWVPQKIFTTDGRPIYFRPSVIFVAKLGRYAIGFGTGDREELTTSRNETGRFYLFVDETDQLVPSEVLREESDFEQITVNEGSNPDLLTGAGRTTGNRGWYMDLLPGERLIADPFGISGVLFFTTFEPEPPEPSCNVADKRCTNPLCSLTGSSRIYLVNTTNADPFLTDVSGAKTRSLEVEGFVTSPFAEQASTRNTSGGPGDGPTADDLTQSEIDVMESLKDLFPSRCKFGNHRIDIKTLAADTRLQRIAPVPICIIEKNWKEF